MFDDKHRWCFFLKYTEILKIVNTSFGNLPRSGLLEQGAPPDAKTLRLGLAVWRRGAIRWRYWDIHGRKAYWRLSFATIPRQWSTTGSARIYCIRVQWFCAIWLGRFEFHQRTLFRLETKILVSYIGSFARCTLKKHWTHPRTFARWRAWFFGDWEWTKDLDWGHMSWANGYTIRVVGA